MGFSNEARQSVASIRDAILGHPFIAGLADGSLDGRRFAFYLHQDAIYLDGFARALAIAAARAPDAAAADTLLASARGVLQEERELHRSRLGDDAAPPSALAAEAASPACLAYVGYLMASAHDQPVPVAVAALLPCFRVYHDVGRAVAARAAADNPYQDWIDNYTDPAFTESVMAMEALADRVAVDMDRPAMELAYRRSTELEWIFWDSAWRQEAWPVTGAGRPA